MKQPIKQDPRTRLNHLLVKRALGENHETEINDLKKKLDYFEWGIKIKS